MKGRLVHITPGGLNQKCEWSTDQEVFDYLNTRFGPFQVDVCALPENAKCSRFFTPEVDGLDQNWAPGPVWMNPPYGRAITEWMHKAYTESLSGVRVVCLLPARTDTGWWHDFAMKGELYLIRRRLKFGGAKQCAPFPSAVSVLG